MAILGVFFLLAWKFVQAWDRRLVTMEQNQRQFVDLFISASKDHHTKVIDTVKEGIRYMAGARPPDPQNPGPGGTTT
jgi:hypothetical protein